MSRYLGPRTKIDRRFHSQVFGVSKAYQNRSTIKKKFKRKRGVSEYGVLLGSKKHVLYLYNMRERQLSNYVDFATKKKENTEDLLARILESRLDNVVYRFGFCKTRRACRQLVSHKHVCVNGRKVNIASYQVKVNDKISLSDKAKANKNINCEISGPIIENSWLKWDAVKKEGEIVRSPTITDIPEKLDYKNVIEFYSR